MRFPRVARVPADRIAWEESAVRWATLGYMTPEQIAKLSDEDGFEDPELSDAWTILHARALRRLPAPDLRWFAVALLRVFGRERALVVLDRVLLLTRSPDPGPPPIPGLRPRVPWPDRIG